MAAIEALSPSQKRLGDRQLVELCRWCLVLARFEQLFRVGLLPMWDIVIEPLTDEPTLEQFAARVVPSGCLADLVTIGRVAIEDHQDLRSAESLILNPTFALSSALGGADADVIASGLLLDFKATAQLSAVRRHDVWQLIGYTLCDRTDTYGIHSVGISAIRRRAWVTWPLDKLLDDLSNRLPCGVNQWRADFGEVAATLAQHRMPRDARRKRSGPPPQG